jgi:hypothetical protein
MPMLFTLIFFTGICLTVASFNFLAAPFVWALPIWVVLFGLAAFVDKVSIRRAIWVNFATILLVLATAEAYYWASDTAGAEERFEGSITTDYYTDHELLGYAPAKNYVATVSKYVGDVQVYNTIYTINSHGLRISPPYSADPGVVAALFFGGSVTFGEGVGDDSAMPYQVGVKSNQRYSIYNFGFHGYGPHQMLAALQNGIVEDVVAEPAKLAVYQAIPTHVMRAAGLASWDKHGPRYSLNEEGQVYPAGHFDDIDTFGSATIAKSYLYNRTFGRHRALREADYLLYLAIVTDAADTFRKRYPGSEFHVILWGYRGGYAFDRILEGLTRAEIPVHLISDILPRYLEEPDIYQISPHDPHPNSEAHGLIASYVATRILKHPDGQ